MSEVDPDVERLLEMAEQYDLSFSDASVDVARQQMEQIASLGATDPPEVETEDVVVETEDAELDARVYSPGGDVATMFFHGGGFVVGSVDTHDSVCRELADRMEETVVSVEYRLSPEHPFPAAVKDAYGATLWGSRRYDAVTVAGDSAGGTLSAVTSLMARDRGMPDVKAQALLYPATAYMEPMESRGENASGYLLEAQDLMWFVDKYIDDEIDARHPYAFPLQARSLEDVAPAQVVTAEFDPLRDEERAYADRLEEDGVDVERVEYDGLVHGFYNMSGFVDAADDALDRTSEFLGSHLRS